VPKSAQKLRKGASNSIPAVDIDEMDLDDLQDHEARWLQDRDQLPPEYAPQPVVFHLPDGTQVTNDPTAINEATAAMTTAIQEAPIDDEAIAAMVEARAQEMAEQMFRDRQHQAIVETTGENTGTATGEPITRGRPATPAPDHSNVEEEAEDLDEEDEDGESEEEDGPEDYDRGWTNNDRRAELSKRGLSIDGTKEELIARLVADDEENSESEDEDEDGDNSGGE
jgi:hypothetical protein